MSNIRGIGVAQLVDRVTADTRDPRFESSHQQILVTTKCTKNGIVMPKIKKKSQGKAPKTVETMMVIARLSVHICCL